MVSIVFLRLFRIEMYLSRYFWLFHEGFVVAQSLRKGSHIPMDMILKKKHNNLAKRPSWIIDVSRKKEAVCKRNLIRHDKLPYTSNLEFLWNHIADDEYNLDHKFSPSANKADKIAVDTLFEYFKANNNPFDDKVTNLVTGEFIDPDFKENMIHIITMGEGVYSEFKSSQLDKKIVALSDPITKTKFLTKIVELQQAP